MKLDTLGRRTQHKYKKERGQRIGKTCFCYGVDVSSNTILFVWAGNSLRESVELRSTVMDLVYISFSFFQLFFSGTILEACQEAESSRKKIMKPGSRNF